MSIRNVMIGVLVLWLAMPIAAHAQTQDCNNNGLDDLTEFDSDGDGVINACDNCLLVANSNQLDTNADGYGNVCDADLDNNGVVNFVDISLFSEQFLSTHPDADLNGDGAVNFLDLSILTPFFLGAPGPGLPESAVTPDADVVDIDGNVYRTLRLDQQIWMAENLKTTRLNTGVAITLYEFGDDWNENNVTFTIPRYRYPDTSDLNNDFDFDLPFDFYGAAYNTATLNTGVLCPSGWRIPTAQDWLTLEAFVAEDGYAGQEADALKADVGWSTDSGFDAYGFTLRASGYVTNTGGATGAPVTALIATSDVSLADNTRGAVSVLASEGTLDFIDLSLTFGSTVRCIKNEPPL